MRENKVSGLPVLEQDKLVGIVTETDIFDALIDILGVNIAHSRIDCFVKDRPGSLAEVTGLIAEKAINILNAVVYFDNKSQRYKMILRIEDLKYEPLLEELQKRGYEIESVIVKESGEE